MPDAVQRRDEVIELILTNGNGVYDGARYKAWVIDQTLRILAGDEYDALLTEHKAKSNSTWDHGVEP